MDSSYVYEKFSNAIYTLGTHPGAIKERLKEAVSELISVAERDVPSNIAADFDLLRQKLTGQEPLANEGLLHAAINAMSVQETVGLAESIFDIEAKLH